MNEQQAQFLKRLVPAVLAWQQKTGLPASALLAQAILESDWGRAALARRNRNLFGIKARPNGAGVVYSTREYAGGKPRPVRARFAVYPNYEACLDDYARLLARPRYARARAVAATPFASAADRQRCGSAPAPRSARKPALPTRRYRLTQYDSSSEARSAKESLPATDD